MLVTCTRQNREQGPLPPAQLSQIFASRREIPARSPRGGGAAPSRPRIVLPSARERSYERCFLSSSLSSTRRCRAANCSVQDGMSRSNVFRARADARAV